MAMHLANQPTPPSDPNLDMILQSLMVDDTDVKRILKGEIHEPINQLQSLIQTLSETVLYCYQTKHVDAKQGEELLGGIKKGNVLLEQVLKQLARYYHMVPYLLLLSPLIRLSNIPGKKVDEYCRKVGIMIGRDKLMSSWDEQSFESHNFYDALLILIEMALHESQEGWKARIVTEEKKTVQTVIHEAGPARKKKFGIF